MSYHKTLKFGLKMKLKSIIRQMKENVKRERKLNATSSNCILITYFFGIPKVHCVYNIIMLF